MASRELSADDAPKIAAAISQLTTSGLKPLFPEEEFPALAREIAEEFEGTRIPDPPLLLTWLDLALTGPEKVFANAVHFQDHCFDVAGEEDYAGVVASIMALAGEEWPDATVSASSVERQGRYGPSRRIEIVIQGQGSAPSFDLIADKDFDWSVVTRLNERLPAGAEGRFAAFFDGDATIVYLKPEQIAELGKLFGYDFVTDVEPLEERPPLHGSRETADISSSRPLPLWALVIGLPIGLFAGSQLVAMILRGAPYAISGSSRVAFAAAPLEFLFLVAMYICGVALFLGGPVYLIARKWRAPRQVPRQVPRQLHGRSA
jgi:hypothetical protein